MKGTEIEEMLKVDRLLPKAVSFKRKYGDTSLL